MKACQHPSIAGRLSWSWTRGKTGSPSSDQTLAPGCVSRPLRFFVLSRVPAKPIPVAPLANNLLQAKMLLQSLQSATAFFDIARWLLHARCLQTSFAYASGEEAWAKPVASLPDLIAGPWNRQKAAWNLSVRQCSRNQTVLIWRTFSHWEILKKHQQCKWATCWDCRFLYHMRVGCCLWLYI